MKKIAKGLLKAVSGIVVLGSGMGLAACNGDVTTNKGSLPEKTLTVSEIYDDLNSSLDKVGLLQNEVNEIAENVYGDANVKAYGLKDDDLQVISMVGDELSSVVVSLPQETIDYLKGDVKDSVLSKAGLTPQQEVKESEKSQIVEKISNAVDYIESKIGAISDLPVGNVNYYTKGEATENADKTFSVISPVREDGTNVLFTVYENGDLTESVIKINDVGNMTTNEIWEAISQGNYEIISQNELDPSSNYEEPPVEETVSFDDIYNQVFGEGFVVADAQSLLNDLAERVFINTTDVKVIAVDTNDCFTIYSQNVDALGRTRLTRGAYKGAYLGEITSYLSLLQQIKNAGGWDEYINSFAPSGSIEEGSETHNKLLATFENIKSTLSNEKIILNTQRSDFSTETVINATREELPAPSNDFGEALLGNMGEKGTIISTYVGDVGAKQIDDTNIFGTGYYMSFGMAVVYTDGSNVLITQSDVIVPWYTNSTNQSLYEEFVSDDGQYKLRNTETTTINNTITVSSVKVVSEKIVERSM